MGHEALLRKLSWICQTLDGNVGCDNFLLEIYVREGNERGPKIVEFLGFCWSVSQGTGRLAGSRITWSDSVRPWRAESEEFPSNI